MYRPGEQIKGEVSGLLCYGQKLAGAITKLVSTCERCDCCALNKSNSAGCLVLGQRHFFLMLTKEQGRS